MIEYGWPPNSLIRLSIYASRYKDMTGKLVNIQDHI